MEKIENKRIFLTVDIEGDWSVFPQEQIRFNAQNIMDNLRRLDEKIYEIKEINEISLPITWFIRCDKSVKANLGSYSGLLEMLEKFIEKKLNIGDVFGIHPHFYSIDEKYKNGKMNSDELLEQLIYSIESWQKFFGERPTFSRMGEGRMNNSLAKELDRQEIKIDASALPGRKRKDNGFDFNWAKTGPGFYKPSKTDYQISSPSSKENFCFLEVPFSMLPTKTKFDNMVINRYFNLAFKNDVIKRSLKNYKAPKDIICVLHPHEINESAGSHHHIISYKEKEFERNISLLLDTWKGLQFHNFYSLLHDDN